MANPPPSPARILFIRPDTYGDLCLFEPVPRIIRDAWPHCEIAVLVRKPYADASVLFTGERIQWLTTTCDPYRCLPGDDTAALGALRDTVRDFAPDCLVAACSNQTWLESAVASFLPDIRQVSLGHGLTDPTLRLALDNVLRVDWAKLYGQKVECDAEVGEWEKNLRLASALLGREAPKWWPTVHVPSDLMARAREVVTLSGLKLGEFVVCAPAGTANVPIKDWPAQNYGEALAWLEREHAVRALIVGHESEREHLEAVQRVAESHGASPVSWMGSNGDMPLLAGILAASRLYLGNDTGALHLAAALSRPVVGVFGGGTWPRFQPIAHRFASVVQPLPCFGCGWDCLYVDAPCIRTISVATVQKALEHVLGNKADVRSVEEADDLDRGARALIDNSAAHLRFLQDDRADRLRQVHHLSAQARQLADRLHISDSDRNARQLQIDELASLLATSEADSATRLQDSERLTTLLSESETDRAARLERIERLTADLVASEADRAARLVQIEELTVRLSESETDRAARFEQIQGLSADLLASEADRAARLVQIEELTVRLSESETDRAARFEQIQGLSADLLASEADRDARLAHIEELTVRLAESETDRAARFEQIQRLSADLIASEADRDARLAHIEELTVRLSESESDRAARLVQIEELTARLSESETDRAARFEQIQRLSADLVASEADRAARLVRIEELTVRLAESETDRAARFEQIQRLSTDLVASEADRAARLRSIEQLTTWLREAESRTAMHPGFTDVPLHEISDVTIDTSAHGRGI